MSNFDENDIFLAELGLIMVLLEHAEDPLTLTSEQTFGLVLFLDKVKDKLGKKQLIENDEEKGKDVA